MGRLLLLSMFFAASSMQAQDCVEPVAGRTSQVYICSNDEPFDLQLFMAPTTDGRESEEGGYFVIGRTGSDPALASGGTIFDPRIDTARTYYYRVDSNGPGCEGTYDTAAMTVFMAPTPDAGTDGTAEILSTAEPTDLYQFLEGTPEEGGSWDTANGISFDPAVDESGTYWYTVEKTTPIGGGAASVINKTCTATASVTVSVIQVSDSGKVVLCHNGKTLEVNQDAVQAHLDHGDNFGECAQSSSSKTVVSPNPSHGDFNFLNKSAEIQTIRILNFQGGLEREFTNTGDLNLLEVNLEELRKGIYFAEVITTTGKEVLRLIKK